MNIVLKVFKELNFVSVDKFEVKHKIDNKDVVKVAVNVLISAENGSQVFLVINFDNMLLSSVVEGDWDLVKEIALQFRRKEYHRAEMDRNTSLLILSKREFNEDVDISSKVKIEDDPFYFKKYVFSYDTVGLENANSWFEENNSKNKLVASIQEYIADTQKFARYKEKNINEPIYSFFVELVTKIHCFPMRIVQSQNINSIDYFLNQELNKIRTKSKDPVNISKEKLLGL